MQIPLVVAVCVWNVCAEMGWSAVRVAVCVYVFVCMRVCMLCVGQEMSFITFGWICYAQISGYLYRHDECNQFLFRARLSAPNFLRRVCVQGTNNEKCTHTHQHSNTTHTNNPSNTLECVRVHLLLLCFRSRSLSTVSHKSIE